MLASTGLPTTTKLGICGAEVSDVDADEVAQHWLRSFAQAVASGESDQVVSLLTEDAWWRDLLAMTWDFRTFQGRDGIKKFLQDRLAGLSLSSFRLTLANIDKPYEDLVWLRGHFTFETEVGNGRGIFRIVPEKQRDETSLWKAHTVLTNLESLKAFPEASGPLRNPAPSHGNWREQRHRETEFLDSDPEVLVIGGGHSGLELAARLKMLGVPTLVCEKRARIGDQWRSRYAALCLHDVVWYVHMPYIPFPANWPVYCPAPKLADWLESYAQSMELDVWTSANVVSVKRAATGKWVVTIRRGDRDRSLRVDHVVFALGVGGGTPNMPKIPGMDFRGQILHSTQYDRASAQAGKKVVVVGACSSAHDIATEYAQSGADVTMWQRSSTYVLSLNKGMKKLMSPSYWEGGPPTAVADLIDNSLPILFRKLVHQRLVKDIAALDRELLDGLTHAGFSLSWGEDDSGLVLLPYTKQGGFYIDRGASQLIIDGKIKLKSQSGGIKAFTADGLVADDGTAVKADVVLFATGYGDPRSSICGLLDDELGLDVSPVWGLDEEGEVRGAWKEIGVPNLWTMMGNLAASRFYSQHLALQIKAKQEGIFGVRYSAPLTSADRSK